MSITGLLPFLRCPRCSAAPLAESALGLDCRSCSAAYPLQDEILDTLGVDPHEVITPFQRIMQTPLVVSIYERVWRRIGYFLASLRSFDREVETILDYKRKSVDSRVMDLACGPGIFTRPLAREGGGVVVGFDLSSPMLRHARRMARREGLANVILIRGTVFRMPFQDGSFQYVNCCGALHLFDRPDDALEEIRRILMPGGRLSVQTTMRPTHSGGFAWFLERFIRFGFFEEPELRVRLGRHGFDILESERHRISFSFLALRR